MTVKTAKVMAADLGEFRKKAEAALEKIEAFQKRLETEPEFQALWESDSAQALKVMGIDPEARQEVGREAYVLGPECDWCITPKGNACHC
ncbi:hypothetical protein [Qipengyuania sp.]|uniref:hypothetical protein n=1 Tax=Qipengyuania sp. TaxID=2004515 RepID=UPI0035C7B4AE